MNIEQLAILGLSLVGAVVAASGVSLDPVQPILLPQAASAKHPLSHLGGNGPWHVGPDVHGIGSAIPENCHVDQAAYVLRHGSRYPDAGAYQGWVEMALRLKSSNYTATGPLSFFHDWSPPLSHPDIQIAQVSQTGSKELFDLGYTLRTRYPNLYNEGDKFTVWANNYTRVLQSAQLFLHGYLGTNASLGTVVSVTGKGFPSHLGDTLAPSDMCPSFKDDSDAQQASFVATWLPAFKKRLARYIRGSLDLDDSMYQGFPYLCGFESQIRGRLSPFCDTFTEAELAAYEYTQDLRYYYGVGPAASVASKMMVPFLHALVDRFVKGPGETGKGFDGEPFDVPKLLMSFLNDGQLVELAVASGVFDSIADLPTDRIDQDRLWRSSNITPMRGTIAFERLNCVVSGTNGTSTATTTATRRTCRPSHTSTPTIPGQQGSRNETFIRIRLNEAVYPLPSCQDGPGKSCSVRKYSSYLADKLAKMGSFADICNATQPGTPTTVLGASFFTNLAQDHLQPLKP